MRTHFESIGLRRGNTDRNRRQLQGADIAADMDRLEKRFRLVRKVEPLFSRHPGVICHEIADPYFRFWFRLIEPAQYQSLAERGSWETLRSICMNALDQYTERTLEDWYRNLFGGSPHWTLTGRWWDRKGANEIGLIAMNELTNAFAIFEIKRNADKIKLDVLARKARAFRKRAGRSSSNIRSRCSEGCLSMRCSTIPPNSEENLPTRTGGGRSGSPPVHFRLDTFPAHCRWAAKPPPPGAWRARRPHALEA